MKNPESPNISGPRVSNKGSLSATLGLEWVPVCLEGALRALSGLRSVVCVKG